MPSVRGFSVWRLRRTRRDRPLPRRPPRTTHRWASLHSAGFASAERVFVVTNAVFYKAFEFWALGKGLDVSHVINTGRTLGDAR